MCAVPQRCGARCGGSSLPYAGGWGVRWWRLWVDARDPHGLGGWWAEGLGWVVVDESPDGVELRPAPDGLPGLLFGADPGRKTGKNRLHLDLRPDDRDAEVAR